MSQKIKLPPGIRKVKVSFRYMSGKDISSPNERFCVRIESRDGSTGMNVSIPQDDNTWREFSGTYSEKIEGNRSIKIVLRGRKGEGTLLLDNICVKFN